MSGALLGVGGWTGMAVLIVPARPVAQATFSVVMSGLDSPRGLAFGPEGADENGKPIGRGAPHRTGGEGFGLGSAD
jgi:hypothetical protein